MEALKMIRAITGMIRHGQTTPVQMDSIIAVVDDARLSDLERATLLKLYMFGSQLVN